MLRRASMADWTKPHHLKRQSDTLPVGQDRNCDTKHWHVNILDRAAALCSNGWHWTVLPFFFVLWGNLDLRKSAISLSSSFSLWKKERSSRKHHWEQESTAAGKLAGLVWSINFLQRHQACSNFIFITTCHMTIYMTAGAHKHLSIRLSSLNDILVTDCSNLNLYLYAKDETLFNLALRHC